MNIPGLIETPGGSAQPISSGDISGPQRPATEGLFIGEPSEPPERETACARHDRRQLGKTDTKAWAVCDVFSTPDDFADSVGAVFLRDAVEVVEYGCGKMAMNADNFLADGLKVFE